MHTDSGWFDLSPFWDVLADIAAKRDAQKLNYASTCNWSQHSTHFIGLLGEKTISLVTGLPMDLSLRVAGDGGRDFKYNGKLYEIRATTYYKDPHLKQKPDARFWADFYICIGIDVANKSGRVFGWASQNDVRNAGVRNYKYGDMLSIPSAQLRKGMPPELPTAAPTKLCCVFDNMFDDAEV